MANIPSYRLHKASGQGVATIAGRDYYFGLHGIKTSKAKYQRLVGEYLAQGRSKSFGQPVNDLTIVELLADYLRFAKNYFGESRNSEFHRVKLVMRTLRPPLWFESCNRVWTASIQSHPRNIVDRERGNTSTRR